MDKAELQALRADEASRILNSPLWITAWDETRQAIFSAWEALPSSDRTQSDELHRTLKNLARLKSVIEKHVQTGKLADKELRARQGIASGLINRLRA